jgi:membrane protease YdiL (CAAX protease family)
MTASLSVLRVLAEKPWRLEAIARLLAAMVMCAFLGSLTATALRYDPATAKAPPLLFYSETVGAALAFLVVLGLVTRPWPLESLKMRVAVLLASAYTGLILSWLARAGSGEAPKDATVQGMILAALSFQGVALPLLWWFVRQHEHSLRTGFGLDQRPGHALLLGAVAGLAFIPVALGLQFGTRVLAELFHIPLPPQDAVLVLNLADSWTDRIALALITIVLAPLAEEGLFRGVFYSAIKGFGYPQAALWGTSLVFAAIHGRMLIFLPLVVLAVLLAKLYERTGNLLSCIAGHAAFNAFNFVMLLLSETFTRSLPPQP